MSQKTIQKGYFNIPTIDGDQWLHFSINCWFNLQQDTGKSFDVFLKELDAEYKKSNQDMLKILDSFTDLVFAAAKAYDQEEDNEINYNRFKVRSWLSSLAPDVLADLVTAMQSTVNVPTDGKK